MTRTLPWSPPDDAISHLLPAGVHWDAVQVPHGVAAQVLKRLDFHTGALIRETGRCDTWLTVAGATTGWSLPVDSGVQLLGVATHLDVPPADRMSGPRLHWARPWTGERGLTDPDLLRAAVELALAGAGGR